MALPLYKTGVQVLDLFQTNWKSRLDPLFSKSFINGKMISNVNLANGSTVIPHGLGGVQQGWAIVDIQGSANVYRSAPFDNTNLTLTSNATVTVSLWVF